jgi:hypothetical protein
MSAMAMLRQLTKSSLTIDGTSNRPAVSKPLRMKPLTMLHSCMMLLTLVSLFAAVPSIFAQQIPELQVGSGALARFGDLLREHNLDLTEDALLRALKNTNSDVRFLAAMKLQEDKAVDATLNVHSTPTQPVTRARVNSTQRPRQIAIADSETHFHEEMTLAVRRAGRWRGVE